MANTSRYFDSPAGAVRQYFGLSQLELASWLGVSKMDVGHFEASRRVLNPATAGALAPLLRLLPPPTAASLQLASAAVAPPLTLAPPEAAPLLARLDHCQNHACRLRRELRPLQAQATVAARWAAAQPALRAALPPDPGPAAEPDGATDWPAWHTWFRHRWLDRRPTVPTQSLGCAE